MLKMVIKPLNELKSKTLEEARIEATIAHMHGYKTLGVIISSVPHNLRGYYVDGHIATTPLSREDIENAFVYFLMGAPYFSSLKATAKTQRQLFSKQNDNWKVTDKRIYTNDHIQEEWEKWLSTYTHTNKATQ